MRTITVRQYRETEPLELDADTLQRLVADHATHLDILPAGGSAVRLRGTNHVGVLRVGEMDILIQPKIDTLSVFWMLGFADRLVDFDPPGVPLEVEAGLLDVLARLFAKQTEAVIRRGIHRAYVEQEENLRFVRGRIDAVADLRTNLGLRHQVACRYTELTADIDHNRILRAVTEQLLRYRFRLPGIREQLGRNLAHLADVGLARVTERDVRAIRYARLDSHYRGVHALASLILRHVTFEFATGSDAAPAFLVDMDSVFEEFLRRLVEEEARRFGLRLRPSTGLYLDHGRKVSIEPDIVLTDGHRVRAAFDAKYKRHDAQADVYQALAYAKGLGLSRVTLLYPADGEVAAAAHRVNNDVVTTIVRTVPVGHRGDGFTAIERYARIAIDSIIAESLCEPVRSVA